MWETLERIGLIIMILGFSALGWLNWSLKDEISGLEKDISAISQKLPITDYRLPIIKNSCGQDCVRELVNEAVANISIPQPEKQEVVEKVVEKVKTVRVSTPKTQYIPLGSGQTVNTSWTELAGSEVTLNINDFGQVTQVFFEVQLESPSGQVFARLWDKRSGSIIIGSEVSHTSGNAKLVSTKISIPSGGRTIIVQLRSEIQQPVKVLSSRLRIDTN